MQICALQIFRYNIPLVKPLKLMGREISARSGILIRVFDEHQYSGWGEIAPFPGIHQEDLPEVVTQIKQFRKDLIGQSISPKLIELNGAFEEWLGGYQLHLSVRYGIELALLNLLAEIYRTPLAGLISRNYRKTVSVNGLLSGTKEEIFNQLSGLVKEGYNTIKLKIGRGVLEDDIKLTKEVCTVLPNSVSLRLDANRIWPLDNAVAFGKTIANDRIEYIEEPLADPTLLDEFYQQTGMPIALDETLPETDFTTLSLPNGIVALILKPSVLGGIEKTMQFATYAQNSGIKAVISSAFQSGIGLAAAANLAACMNQQDVPAGLDTYKWLAEDVLAERFTTKDGCVDAEEAYENGKNVRLDLVKLVE